MGTNELIKELRHMAFIMSRMGDLRKAAILNLAADELEVKQ